MVPTLRCRKRGKRVSAALRLEPAVEATPRSASVPVRDWMSPLSKAWPTVRGGSEPPQPRHRPCCARSVARRGRIPRVDAPGRGRHSLSHGAAFQTWSAPTGRQGMIPRPMGISHHATPSRPGPFARAPRPVAGPVPAGRRAAYHHLPEPRGGPHPASLSCHARACDPDGPFRRRTAAVVRSAVRSSGLDDKAHADRRQPRGRDPRGGAGR